MHVARLRRKCFLRIRQKLVVHVVDFLRACLSESLHQARRDDYARVPNLPLPARVMHKVVYRRVVYRVIQRAASAQLRSKSFQTERFPVEQIPKTHVLHVLERQPLNFFL